MIGGIGIKESVEVEGVAEIDKICETEWVRE